MKFSTDKPLVYNQCHDQFGVNWEDGIVITYGDTIYCKFSPLTPDLIVHESVHIRQQKELGPMTWWEHYFEDKDFRLKVELEAYRAQIDWMREHYNRHERKRIEAHIYKTLETNYGGICTREEAKKLLS